MSYYLTPFLALWIVYLYHEYYIKYQETNKILKHRRDLLDVLPYFMDSNIHSSAKKLKASKIFQDVVDHGKYFECTLWESKNLFIIYKGENTHEIRKYIIESLFDLNEELAKLYPINSGCRAKYALIELSSLAEKSKQNKSTTK